ncbi:hypothetical protein V500_07379 [Pseudogymnoascus sp. VKM F-4518 (FW-2643)]|nr:hypothetical protein V500_07379 [Pseudogymnoascus sp. VKM F-4518 (FW-2643)]
MTTRAMKNVEKAFKSHGKSLDENGNEIKSPGSKNVDRGFEKEGSADAVNKENAHEGTVHPGRQQQERFGDQYRKPSLIGSLFYSNFSQVDHGTKEHDKKR